MTFRELLNEYLSELKLTPGSLSKLSGVSLSAISRYRSGERIPSPTSPQLQALASAIAQRSQQLEGAEPLAERDVLLRMATAARGIAIDHEGFRRNLAALMETLGIGNNEIARALSFDPSYISRVLSGLRQPSNLPAFSRQVAELVEHRITNTEQSLAVAQLVGCPSEQLQNHEECVEVIRRWLTTNTYHDTQNLGSVLQAVDEFDPRVFEELAAAYEAPSLSLPQGSTRKQYFGISGFKEAELTFLRLAAQDVMTEPVVMYYDMPLNKAYASDEFLRTYNVELIKLLRKGQRLAIIHNLNRPVNELLRGLRQWVPLYLTGMIEPYYLEEPQGTVFMHNHKVAKSVALEGRAIAGHHTDGAYAIITDPEELASSQLRARQLLEKALPIMHVFRQQDTQSFLEECERCNDVPGTRSVLLPLPPLETLPAELLDHMLETSALSQDEKDLVRSHARSRREAFDRRLESHDILMTLGLMTKDDFHEGAITYEIPCLALSSGLAYDYSQYLAHLEATRSYAREHARLRLTIDPAPKVRNVHVIVCRGTWAVVSRSKQPIINFLIDQPQVVATFESVFFPHAPTA